MLAEKMFLPVATSLPVAYVTEWTFIGLQNVWLLLYGDISSELS